jgi:hypothetical protein
VFEQEVLGDAATVLGDVLRELHAAALH